MKFPTPDQVWLCEACGENNQSLVVSLLSKNISPHVPCDTKHITSIFDTPFNNKTYIIKNLSYLPSITPLMIAAYRSNESILGILLDPIRDNYHSKNKFYYERLLEIAIEKRIRPPETIVRMILEKGFETSGSPRLMDFAYKTYTSPKAKPVSQPIQRLICDSYGMCALFKSTDIIGALRMFTH